jgi:hypothetical protein
MVIRVDRTRWEARALADAILGGVVGASLGIGVALLWNDRTGQAIVTAPLTFGILGAAFASRVRRGDPVEQIAARMGIAAVVLASVLTPPLGMLLVLAFGIVGAIGLTITIPVSVAWVLLMRLALAIPTLGDPDSVRRRTR